MEQDTSMAQKQIADDMPVLCAVNDSVAIITLNRPKAINALSEDVLSMLQSTFDKLAADKTVNAIILRTSSQHFCAGHNLKEMTAHRQDDDNGKAYFIDLFATCSKLMQTIVTQPQPVIAEVRGIATAAGCQLVAACDLAVASETARFATSGVNIGLFCSTPMVALSRNVTRKQALEMLLLGEFISAERVCQMGLINHVVQDADLERETMKLAQIIAQKSAAAVQIGKKAFYEQLEMPLQEAYAHAGQIMAENMLFQDAEAGIGAFITKDKMPQWKGK